MQALSLFGDAAVCNFSADEQVEVEGVGADGNTVKVCICREDYNDVLSLFLRSQALDCQTPLHRSVVLMTAQEFYRYFDWIASSYSRARNILLVVCPSLFCVAMVLCVAGSGSELSPVASRDAVGEQEAAFGVL